MTVKVTVLDVNDNAPEIINPREEDINVREGQPPGTEVVKVKAVDADNGDNSSITYSIVRNRLSESNGVFSIDPTTGIVTTQVVLDHQEKTTYSLTVTATDGGNPSKQSTRTFRVEVLNLDDNKLAFTNSSSVFRVSFFINIVLFNC